MRDDAPCPREHAIRYIVETAPATEHFNLRKMFAATPEETVLYMAVGKRRIGKTLQLQYVMCRLWLEFGLTTIWLRNRKEEFKDDFYPRFLNACKRLGWCPDTWICDSKGVREDKDGTPICTFGGLGTFSNKRGNESFDTQMVVLDEMMPEDRRYPRTPHKALMSLVMTTTSGREGAYCFCLSNFVSSGNPYFAGFEVYPDRRKDVTLYPEKNIAIEVCRGYKSAMEPTSPWTKVFKAGRYAEYSDAEEDKLFSLIAKVPKGATPYRVVLLISGVEYRAHDKDGLCYWDLNRTGTKDAQVYTDDVTATCKDVALIPKWLRKQMDDLAEANLNRFTTVNVMYSILQITYSNV